VHTFDPMRVLRSGAPAALAAALIALPLHAAPLAASEVTWIGGGIQAPGTPASRGSQKFVELVRERTDGRLDFQHHDAAILGTANQQMEAIALGTQQFYISSAVAASNLVPQLGILDAAFLFDDHDHVNAFNRSDIRAEIDKRLIDEFGIRVIASNWFRMPRYFLHREEFIVDAETLADRRVRAPNLPIHLRNWECLGANPVVVAYQEQYLALAQGLVEMTEISGEQLYGMKLHEVAPYVTDAFHGYPLASVYVSEAAFQALSPEDREIVVEAALEAGDYQSQLVRERFEPEWEKVMAEGGKFQPLTDEQRATFVAKMAECVTELVEEGMIPEGWWEEIRAMR